MVVGEDQQVEAQTVGRVASFYYLKHQTMAGFMRGLQPNMAMADVCTRDRVVPATLPVFCPWFWATCCI